jgi:hypothetical protein
MSNFPNKKQLRAYFLVEVMNESQTAAAELMGISKQAISRLLRSFYKYKPDLNEEPPVEKAGHPQNFEDHIEEVF